MARFRIELNEEIAETILDGLFIASAATIDTNKEESKKYWEIAGKFSDCLNKVKERKENNGKTVTG